MPARCRECGGSEWKQSADPDEHGRCRECRSFPTLGFDVITLIEEKAVIPDRDQQGDRFVMSVEQGTWTLHFYRVDPFTGRFVASRGGQLVGPQKWGKGPFVCGLVVAEAHPEGPVRFDGWNADGQPVGKPEPSPWIQVTAAAKDQTDNIWDALVPMIELGDLAADMPDTGKTRIILPDRGKIEPVSAAGGTRRGQRITFAPQDETSDWFLVNGSNNLADTQRRNLAGTGGRFVDTANAWDPARPSVAQMTHEEGLAKGVYSMMLDAGPGSIKNKAERARMIRRVYGSHLMPKGWIDPERIDGEIMALIDRDPAQAERFFINRPSSGGGRAFEPEKIDDAIVSGGRPERGATITVGVDGAMFRDAIAVIACDGETGHKWPLKIIERPPKAPPGYMHDLDAVDGALIDAVERWDVWRIYVDPQYIDDLFKRWQGRWGEERVLPWLTHRPYPMCHAVRRYTEGLGKSWTIDDDAVFVAHHRNARKKVTNVKDDEDQLMHILAKESQDSPLKIDGSMGSILADEGRNDWIAAGKPRTRPRSRVPRSYS